MRMIITRVGYGIRLQGKPSKEGEPIAFTGPWIICVRGGAGMPPKKDIIHSIFERF